MTDFNYKLTEPEETMERKNQEELFKQERMI